MTFVICHNPIKKQKEFSKLLDKSERIVYTLAKLDGLEVFSVFTREYDYALRIIRNLSTDVSESITIIADREHITTAIAYKVARKLSQADMIRSKRGISGGYYLTRGLDEITLLDVLHAVEPHTALVECTQEGHHCPMNTEGSPCKVHCAFLNIQQELFNAMSRQSLYEIMTSDPVRMVAMAGESGVSQAVLD